MVSRRRFLLAAVPIALAIGPAVSAAAPPVSTAPPAIDGLVLLGGTVNCREGGWENVPDAVNVSWTRDGAPIAGADRRQYAIAEQDVGRPAALRRDRLRGNGEGDGDLGRRDSPTRRPRRRTRPRRAGGPQGPAGAPGATGKPGAPGPAGPQGSPPPTATRSAELLLIPFSDRLTARPGSDVRIVAAVTAPAALQMTVRRGERTIATVGGYADAAGRVALTWKPRDSRPGRYRLSLRAIGDGTAPARRST